MSGEAEGTEAEVWEVQPEEGTAAAEAAAAAHDAHAEGDDHDDGFGGGTPPSLTLAPTLILALILTLASYPTP